MRVAAAAALTVFPMTDWWLHLKPGLKLDDTTTHPYRNAYLEGKWMARERHGFIRTTRTVAGDSASELWTMPNGKEIMVFRDVAQADGKFVDEFLMPYWHSGDLA